jgi:type VI secretion system secreted protein VgrG
LQVSIASKLPGVVTSPLAINKAGTTVEDLLILIANTSAGQGVLGRARSFGVAGGQGITNVGNTVITGDLSIFPGAPATGFPPGTVTGTQHVNDPDAFGCFADAGAAYAVLSSLVGFVDLTGQNLGGQTLSPGTYRFAADAPLTGTLVLDAAGDLNASFVFQIGTTLDVDPGAIVSLAGSAIAGQVFWTVATDATLGAGSTFEGSILAINHIGLGAGANIVAGRALIASIQGVVDLEDNEITVPSPAGANNSGELEIYIRFH